jgi:hypothetical protein
VHPAEQQLGRRRADPAPLKLQDFLALAPDMDAHLFDFPSDEVEVWHRPLPKGQSLFWNKP